MRIMGIDPGIEGAIALFDGNHLIVEDVPVVLFKKKGKKTESQTINTAALADLFNILFAGADHAYIEQVGAMPNQGVTSMFNFGNACGKLEMGVAMTGVPYTFITPTAWKMEMGLNNTADKSLLRVNQLFPRYSSYFARKMDHNRAEAALLSWYGYQKLTVGKVERPHGI